uniref:Uncharacterized protein n=1 Tax=Rhizophora mucronata TaxID=61149 RepID=A0A2P2NDN2_RHIMU
MEKPERILIPSQ